MIFQKLASAIRNDVVTGLRGLHNNPSMSLELLEDDIVDERLQIIKEYALKGIVPIKDLLLSINCIDVDCKSMEKCLCEDNLYSSNTLHFEIPLLLNDYGIQAISYIGSIDKQTPFVYYTSRDAWSVHKYRKRGKNKPYVWIDTTPNENGMYDCFIFNAPLLKLISISAIFKDPRQLERYSCCNEYMDDNFSFINNEIKKRLIEKKIRYYRQFLSPIVPNDLTYLA